MSSKIPTVWDIEPHTEAKHRILEEYLKAWFPIIGNMESKIVYIDGFAGPGIYSNKAEGSPIIAIQTAINQPVLESTSVIFHFIEKHKVRADRLRQTLTEKFPHMPAKFSYQIIQEKFANNLGKVLDNIESNGANLAPTFAFLDPFGYSDIPLNIISRILRYDKCEVLITFMSGFVNRFTDPLRENSLDELYGTTKWREVRTMDDADQRIDFLVGLYVTQLKQNEAKYVRTFRMTGKDNNIIYDLVFATKHWKGIEVMKNAMLKADERGTYKFSDRTDPNQTYLFGDSNDNWIPDAANQVYEKFKGKPALVTGIKKFVVISTPYKFKKAILKYLEKQVPSKIERVNGRNRQFTYPDNSIVWFSK